MESVHNFWYDCILQNLASFKDQAKSVPLFCQQVHSFCHSRIYFHSCFRQSHSHSCFDSWFQIVYNSASPCRPWDPQVDRFCCIILCLFSCNNMGMIRTGEIRFDTNCNSLQTILEMFLQLHKNEGLSGASLHYRNVQRSRLVEILKHCLFKTIVCGRWR
jgi:hypothetical protein